MNDETRDASDVHFSDDTTALDEAMAKAQGEFGHVVKDSKNPHFKKTYASLTAINQAIRPVLAKHGITVVQWPLGMTPRCLTLFTRVAFKGQFIQAITEVPVARADVQGWGAALTYAKRYTLAAIFGLSEDDDDGESAVARPLSGLPTKLKPEPKQSAPMLAPKPKALASDAVLDRARNYTAKVGVYTGKALKDLSREQLMKSVKFLEEASGEGKPLLPPAQAEFLSFARIILADGQGEKS